MSRSPLWAANPLVLKAGYSFDVPRPLTDLASWTTSTEWPRTACPICFVGSVGYEKSNQTPDVESQETLAIASLREVRPEELSGTFNGTLLCDNSTCRAQLSMAGDWAYSWDVSDEGYTRLFNLYLVRFVTPPLRLFVPPERTPQKVKDEIIAAASVLFVSPSAAGNRLRRAVEELLDTQGIRKTRNGTKALNKRVRMTLHDRIKEFGMTRPDVEKVLLAVKWIGNDASHGQELVVADVVLCAEVLEAALKSLYDRRDAELLAIVSRINARKGLGKRK